MNFILGRPWLCVWGRHRWGEWHTRMSAPEQEARYCKGVGCKKMQKRLRTNTSQPK